MASIIKEKYTEQFAQLYQYDNPDIDINKLSSGSKTRVTWRCDKGHTWVRDPYSRFRKEKPSECPYCTNTKLWSGYNDIDTVFSNNGLHKEISEWSPRNGVVGKEVSAYSSKKYWWSCDKGHEYDMTPKNRLRGQGCPYCHNRRILVGFNDLLSNCPIVKYYWDSNKNSKSPEEVIYGAKTSCWFICDNNHSFSYSSYNISRTGKVICAICEEDKISNKKKLIEENKKAFYDAKLRRLYDKYSYLEKYYSVDNDLDFVSALDDLESILSWECEEGHNYRDSIRDLHARKNKCLHCSGHKITIGVNDFATIFSDKVKDWDIVKNGGEIPDGLYPFSSKKYWWLCDKGHSYEMSLNDKARAVYCPVCSSHRILSGYNDLETRFPDIAIEWDHEKNDLKPESIFPSSAKKYWWTCPIGHSYSATPNHRIHGRGCSICSNKKVVKGINDIFTTSPHLENQWDYNKNDSMNIHPEKLNDGSATRAWWVCDNGHSWNSTIVARKQYGCPKCAHIVSSSEQELFDMLRSVLPNDVLMEQSNRSIITPYELDIYFPDLNIAIEYNGLYWHSHSRLGDKNKHYNKWKACADNGVQLIAVWEDDWVNNKSLVMNMLLHKLGYSSTDSIYARNCGVVSLDYSNASEFLNSFHIQGSVRGSYYYGLVDHNGVLAAVSVWRRNGSRLYLDRYATSKRVVGGCGKLLKHVVSTCCDGVDEIVTFSDNSLSDGSLYENLRFIVDDYLKPDYSYIVDGKREHKFGYRKKRFMSDPMLDYRENLTESQLALLNGIDRVYDYGKVRWIMPLT